MSSRIRISSSLGFGMNALLLLFACGEQSKEDAVHALCSLPEHVDMQNGGLLDAIFWVDEHVKNAEVREWYMRLHTDPTVDYEEEMRALANEAGISRCEVIRYIR